MADSTPSPYADAQAQADASTRAELQQLAATGVSGNATFNQAQQQGVQDRKAAIQKSLASAAFSGQGATPADAAPYMGMIGGAYDQRIGTTGDLGAAFRSANQI